MTLHLDAADIAAIRAEEGGLTALIAALTSRTTPARTIGPPPVGSAHAPGHRPGAWPTGIHAPTGSATCSPDCDCALDHHARPAADTAA